VIVSDILFRTVLKLSQITVQILNILRFEPPDGGIGATYTVYLRLTGKLVVDFLFLLIELFALGVTAEALRANIDNLYSPETQKHVSK